MTPQQVTLFRFTCAHLVILAAVVFLTRATPRRIVGALVGAAAAGILALGIIALGDRAGWWHFVIAQDPLTLAFVELDFILSSFAFLIAWRIARRFGRRGLAIALLVAAVLGPPRDYWYMLRFPEWGAFAPGITPLLAISSTYIILGIAGYAIMRLIAGPATADLIRRATPSSG